MSRPAAAWLALVLLLPAGVLAAPADAAVDVAVDAAIARMSDDEKLAQLLFVGFSGTRMNDEIRRLAGTWRVGAIAVYARNVDSPRQLQELTREIRALSGDALPPLIAVDQEGGEVARIADGVAAIPGNMALGATRSEGLAYRAGLAVGADLRRLGVTMNLAPVLDVATNPRAAIGIRSYGEDPSLAAALGAAFVRGQRAAGIVSVGKHFPGIGDAAADSHERLLLLAADLDELRRVHFVPFRAAIEAGAEGIMVAHAAVPAVGGATPASVSKTLIALLRDELHFDGIVVSDVLEMDALEKRSGVGRAAVDSILAGADLVMVLWKERDREEALAALRGAYRSGELTEERLRASLRRIVRVKLATRQLAEPPARDARIADEIAEGAVTLLRNGPGLVPLRRVGERIAYIGPPGPLADGVRAGARVELPARLDAAALRRWSERARQAMSDATLLVAVAQNESQLAVIRAAHDARKEMPLIFVSLGLPRLIAELPDADAYLCAYGYLAPSQRAVARVLAGTLRSRGRLPVAVPPLFPAGAGITP